MEHIRKEFPGVIALDDVSLSVHRGTVHALMGENGAGKSTLMKILNGIYPKTSGTIIWDGELFEPKSITEVINTGITMVFQELNNIKTMKVYENIYVGREPYKFKHLIIDYKKMLQDAIELFNDLGIEGIDPKAPMKTLSTAQMQMVEIAKAISYNSKLIILDEPTSSITENECEHLFQLVERLKNKGVAFIFISHKMDEIFKISDEITVLRDGKYIGTYKSEEITQDELVKLMVGREITNMFPKGESKIGDVKLSVSNLNVPGLLYDISFDVKKGEILGFAGLMGAGRTEVMETIFGLRKMSSGVIKIDGEEVSINSPQDAIKKRIMFLTEDRRGTGCFLSLPVRDNIMVCNYDLVLNQIKKINKTAEKKIVDEQIDKYSIKTPSQNQAVGKLSGGNQQKVLIARWLLMNPDIVIMDEPTRGIDVGSKTEIHQMISNLAERGAAIIMISSELPEVLGMSDRIIVMHEGRISGELDRREADQVKIMQFASGLQ